MIKDFYHVVTLAVFKMQWRWGPEKYNVLVGEVGVAKVDTRWCHCGLDQHRIYKKKFDSNGDLIAFDLSRGPSPNLKVNLETLIHNYGGDCHDQPALVGYNSYII